MSEISYDTMAVIEAEDHGDVPGSSTEKFVNPEWDDSKLFNFVFTHQDELVRIGDAVMTLSEAMNAHPGPWTPENEPNLMAYAEHLYNNRLTETEEPEKEEEKKKEDNESEAHKTTNTEESYQKSTAETDQTEKADSNKVYEEGQPKREIESSKPPGQSASTVEKSYELGDITVELAKDEATLHPIEASVTIVNERSYSHSKPEKPTTRVSLSGSSVRKPVVDKINGETTNVRTVFQEQLNEKSDLVESAIEIKQPLLPLEKTKTEMEAEPSIKSREAESLVSPLVIEETPEAETVQLSSLGTKESSVLGGTSELTDEKDELTEDEWEQNFLVQEMGSDNYMDFDAEEEILVEHIEAEAESYEPNIEKLDDDSEEIFLASDGESPLWEQVATETPEELAEVGLIVEEVEDVLAQLAEKVEEIDEQTEEKLNKILDKIIEIPAGLVVEGENGLTGTEAQEELEKLFVELFENAGLEYTPELIESLTYLALRWNLIDEIEGLKNKKEVDEVPQEGGTHEIIKQILVSLSNVKRAMTHAYAIGKSALRLCSFSLSSSPSFS